MKKYIFILVIFPFLFQSCSKEKSVLCETPLCVEYQKVWEELFKSRNNISTEYFNEHITVISTDVQSWNDGESFNIVYYNEIGWAKINNQDNFIIKKSTNAPPYLSLDLPIDIYLTNDKINLAVDNLALSSRMTKINPHLNLKFNSKTKAIQAVKAKIPYKNAKFGGVYYKSEKWTFKSNGNPFLKFSGKIKSETNKCYYGEIDLITGEVSYIEDSCAVE